MPQTLSYEDMIRLGFFAAGIHCGASLHAYDEGHGTPEENTASRGTVSVHQKIHRLAPVAGIFEGDPTWAEYQAALQEIRREEDEINAE